MTKKRFKVYWNKTNFDVYALRILSYLQYFNLTNFPKIYTMERKETLGFPKAQIIFSILHGTIMRHSRRSRWYHSALILLITKGNHKNVERFCPNKWSRQELWCLQDLFKCNFHYAQFLVKLNSSSFLNINKPFYSPMKLENQNVPLDHRKSKRAQEKHPLLLYWFHPNLWLCGSQQTVENSSRDGNTRPPYLPPEKSVCSSRSNS